jgi:hypothetical protein
MTSTSKPALVSDLLGASIGGLSATRIDDETPDRVRADQLRERVWRQIPKHLIDRPLKPEFQRLVDEFDWTHSFLLLGHTGAGKSTACVHLVRRLLRDGVKQGGTAFDRAKSIFWTRADTITRAGVGAELSDHQLLHRAKHAKLVIIDDMAEASKTMLGVLQARYDSPDPRPMVVTSGAVDVSELERRLGGEAVVRWILDCGGVKHGVVLHSAAAKKAGGK